MIPSRPVAFGLCFVAGLESFPAMPWRLGKQDTGTKDDRKGRQSAKPLAAPRFPARDSSAPCAVFGHTRNWYFLNIGVVEQPGVLLKLFYFVTVLEKEAVVIFFVLSGFLIGGSLANSMQRGGFDLGRYLIARFVRIYIVSRH
jgi:hypothetical protein